VVSSNPARPDGGQVPLDKKSLEITPGIEPLYGTRDENLRLLEDGLRSRSISIGCDPGDGSPDEGVERVERIFADYESLRKSGVTLQNGELKGMLKLVIADPAVTLKSLVESGQAAVGGGEADGAAALAQPAQVC
jgi:phosphate starvation-inducible PhoH-like protein